MEYLFQNELINRAFEPTDPNYWRCYVTHWEDMLENLEDQMRYANREYLAALESMDIGKPVDADKISNLLIKKNNVESEFANLFKDLGLVVGTLNCIYEKNSIAHVVSQITPMLELYLTSVKLQDYEPTAFTWASLSFVVQVGVNTSMPVLENYKFNTELV